MPDPAGVIEPRRPLDAMQCYRVRQGWRQPDLADIPAAAVAALERAGALQSIGPGDEIAITAGSRGIAAMPTVLRAVVEAVKGVGGRPFIFPAMGSHGGGTAEGQRELLAGLGVTEETMGAPIRATMEVVQLGATPDGIPVYLDAYAARAAGIIMVNRIKKHTNFDASYESGLVKMAVIGMGKHTQAVAVHQFGSYGFEDVMPRVAAVVFAKAPVLAGLALVENAWGGLADLVGLRADEILAKEPALLRRAKELSAKIPFKQVEIGVVEWIGKEISGTGMDCYVIGRKRIIGAPEWPETIPINSLVALDVTPASHGNALGLGLADFTTRRLVEKIDWPALRKNVLTSGNLERGKIPLAYDTDREALEAASFRERLTPVEELRLVAIRDTLHLREMIVSAPLLIDAGDSLDVLDGPFPLPLGADGMWAWQW